MESSNTFNSPEQDYPSKFLKGFTVFPDDARIFHRLGYQYDNALAVEQTDFDGKRAAFDLTMGSGERCSLSVEPIAPGVLRMKIGPTGTTYDETSAMLMPFPDTHPGMDFDEETNAYNLGYSGYRLQLQKRPFCIKIFSPAGELIFESETEKLVEMFTAPPLGLRRKDEAAWAYLSWRSRNEDRYFGLGEKFTRFEKTSSRATIWEADTCGSNTTDMSYKAVPVLFSTAGWGLVLHSSFRSYWEIGSFSYATASLMVEDSKLDLFLILAASLKGQLQAYTALTGRPQRPPKWAFGLWMSRAPYRNRAQLLEVADRLRAEQIPCDVFNIDPTWMVRHYYNDIGVEVCNFDWNAADWGSPEDLFATFKEKGYNICLWINPYFSEDSPAYAEAKEKGYLVSSVDGGIARLEFNLAAGIVDFTNPEARAWWQEKLTGWLRQGAAVFKVDFGDRVPENALFFNGRTGAEMHNLFTHLYVQAVYEAVESFSGTGMVWRRLGYIGTQRYPGTWAGDTQVTWEGMKGALRGGLSAAITGEAFWSHDIGGFVGPKPSDELYIRWVQFGLLSPLSRFHGTTPREPWHYSEKALQVTRHYTRLRYALIPYLLAMAQVSAADGTPMMRPMVLEFPDEAMIDQVDDQYLLGSDLLVAPVFKPGASSRVVCFPRGRWWRLEEAGQMITPAGFQEVAAPLESLPLYVRGGAVIPRYASVPEHLKGPVPQEWIIDIYPGDSHRQLKIPENGFEFAIDYQNDGGAARLQISPAPLTFTIRTVGAHPENLQVNHAAAEWTAGQGYASFEAPAGDGLLITFQSTE
jgi:alpha-D-xyloside xylohydrolase